MSDILEDLWDKFFNNIKGFIFFGIVGGTILFHLLMRKGIWSFEKSFIMEVF